MTTDQYESERLAVEEIKEARILQEEDPGAAKRYLLETLADAPRFREAHRLLLKVRDKAKEPPPASKPDEERVSPTNQKDSL